MDSQAVIDKLEGLKTYLLMHSWNDVSFIDEAIQAVKLKMSADNQCMTLVANEFLVESLANALKQNNPVVTTLEDFQKEQLEDLEFKKEYDALDEDAKQGSIPDTDIVPVDCIGCFHESKSYDCEPCCYCARQFGKTLRQDYYKYKGEYNENN